MNGIYAVQPSSFHMERRLPEPSSVVAGLTAPSRFLQLSALQDPPAQRAGETNHGSQTRATGESRATEEAARLVGAALLEPFLAELRESGFAAGPFAPSDVEKRFGPLMDAALTDRLAIHIGGPLAKAIAQRYASVASPPPSIMEDIHA